MRKIASVFSVLIGLASNPVHAAESTNWPPSIPKMFASMTDKDVYPGLAPVAVYECLSNQAVRIVCMGAAIAPYGSSCQVILPAGIFADPRFKGAFGVRILRPDSGCLIGCINRVTFVGPNKDVAIGTIGTNETHLSSLSMDTNNYPVFPTFAPNPAIDGLQVKRVSSLLTGMEVRIAGQGIPITKIEDEKFLRPDGKGETETVGTVDPGRTYLVIEDDPHGKDGGVFFDDHGRIYVFHNGFVPSGATKIGAALIKDFTDHYGVAPQAVAALAGPITLPVKRTRPLPPTSLRAISDSH